MTTKEKQIIVKMESKYWADLQRAYYLEALECNSNDFDSVFEFQKVAGAIPYIGNIRSAWAAVADICTTLGIETTYNEIADFYWNATRDYFKK